jgi:hypothetical protein
MGEPAAVEPAAGEETPTGAGWVSASQRVGEAPVRSLPVQEMVAVRDTMQLPADKRPMRLLGALKDLVSELQFFQNLTSKLQKLVCRQLRPLDLTAGDNVFEQGDEGWEFFILLLGEVDVFIDGERVASLQEGTAFGELALIEGGQKHRAATVSCKGQCFFGVLDRKEYKWIVQQQTKEDAGDALRNLSAEEMEGMRATMQLPADKRPLRLLGALME